mgnify:CR=1 FL=1
MSCGVFQVDRSDFDMIDYLNELRESCLDAYTGIIQGLKGAEDTPNPEVQLLSDHVPSIMEFVTRVASDSEKSDSVIASSAGLIGYAVTTKLQTLLKLYVYIKRRPG